MHSVRGDDGHQHCRHPSVHRPQHCPNVLPCTNPRHMYAGMVRATKAKTTAEYVEQWVHVKSHQDFNKVLGYTEQEHVAGNAVVDTLAEEAHTLHAAVPENLRVLGQQVQETFFQFCLAVEHLLPLWPKVRDKFEREPPPIRQPTAHCYSSIAGSSKATFKDAMNAGKSGMAMVKQQLAQDSRECLA